VFTGIDALLGLTAVKVYRSKPCFAGVRRWTPLALPAARGQGDGVRVGPSATSAVHDLHPPIRVPARSGIALWRLPTALQKVLPEG